MHVQQKENTVVKNNTHDRCLVCGSNRKSPEKWSALSAVKLQQGCNLYFTGKQVHTTCHILTLTSKLKLMIKGEFHISHDASLQTILSSFRTHVILSVQASSTGTRQLNNAGKRLLLPIKPSVPLLCRSIYDFRFTIPSISVVMSKRVFWPPIMG